MGSEAIVPSSWSGPAGWTSWLPTCHSIPMTTHPKCGLTSPRPRTSSISAHLAGRRAVMGTVGQPAADCCRCASMRPATSTLVLLSGQTIRYLLRQNGVWNEGEAIGVSMPHVWNLSVCALDQDGGRQVAGNVGANGSFHAVPGKASRLAGRASGGRQYRGFTPVSRLRSLFSADQLSAGGWPPFCARDAVFGRRPPTANGTSGPCGRMTTGTSRDEAASDTLP